MWTLSYSTSNLHTRDNHSSLTYKLYLPIYEQLFPHPSQVPFAVLQLMWNQRPETQVIYILMVRSCHQGPVSSGALWCVQCTCHAIREPNLSIPPGWTVTLQALYSKYFHSMLTYMHFLPPKVVSYIHSGPLLVIRLKHLLDYFQYFSLSVFFQSEGLLVWLATFMIKSDNNEIYNKPVQVEE